jgi:pimeloyl-ACP methyl ester carboxylesterase
VTDSTETPLDLESRFADFRASATERRRVVDGLEWHWFEGGTGPTAFVALPGAVGGGDMFFLLLQECSPSLRVMTMDLPSVVEARPLVDRLRALFEAEGVERAVLLGASFSGLFAQAFAGTHPDRVAAVVLSHTGTLDPTRAPRSRAFAARVRRWPLWFTRGLLKLLVRALLRGSPGKRFWTRRYDEVLNDLTRDAMASRYELAASLDEGAWPRWTGPVLIIHSDNDAVAKPIERSRLAAAYPGATWLEFRGTGHSSYTRQPETFCRAVATHARAFAAQPPAASSVPDRASGS